MSTEKDPSLWTEVFNERALILTFFGALGGSVRAAVLKTSWTEGIRVIFVGGTVAFGIGILGPIVLEPWIGDMPDEMTGALGTLTAASFLIGLIAVTLVERVIEGRPPISNIQRTTTYSQPQPQPTPKPRTQKHDTDYESDPDHLRNDDGQMELFDMDYDPKDP